MSDLKERKDVPAGGGITDAEQAAQQFSIKKDELI